MNDVCQIGSVAWVTVPSTLTDARVSSVLGELEELLRRGASYVLMFDMRAAAMPSSHQRESLALHIRANRDAIRRCVRGVGVVASSPLLRGAVTAIFWIEPPGIPHRVLRTIAEAQAWAAELLP
jgi:hypothetical protein